MDEAAIRAFQQALSRWCWDHGFDDFCAATGFTGACAQDKWRELKAANEALSRFDAATLAKILAPFVPTGGGIAPLPR